MKKVPNNNFFVICVSTLVLCSIAPALYGYSRKNLCTRSEEKVYSVPDVRPEWAVKLHFATGQDEYFVGISTQNDKLENGITLAVENATNSITEAIGEVIKTKSQGVLTMVADDVRQSWGSVTSATYLAHKEKKDIYYEKWTDYPNCRPHSFYNVWVLLKVPKSEFDSEAKAAVGYLRKVQQQEQARKAESLLLPGSTVPIPAGQLGKGRGPGGFYVPALQEPAPFEPPVVYPHPPFSCGSIAMYGGWTYIPPFNSEMGKQESGTFDVNFDGEFGITENICMGIGMGYAMTRREGGDEGHIVPMFLRVALKGPLTSGHGIIGWIGGELGGALLNGFNREDSWSNKQKDTGAFMVGPAGGIDIRIQSSLYLTLGAAYLPIFYHETIQMIQTRGGIRYYIW